MKLITSLSEIPASESIGITIGNFDGLHLGHREFFTRILEYSKARDLKLVVITFIPHPRLILCPRDNFLINSYYERRDLLSELQVDYLLEVEFTRDFSTLAPQDFLDKYVLQHKRGLKAFFLGYDFVFGANKSGDPSLVQDYCHRNNIAVVVQNEYQRNGVIVSSSVIRDHILQGDMARVSDLLGRDFYISGCVVKGKRFGHSLGFPTVNLQYSRKVVIPASGVYVSKTQYAGKNFFSCTNVGNNPTFEDSKKTSIETHLFDFDKEIYGETIKVMFIKRLRDEKKFPAKTALIGQITRDLADVKKYFGL